MEIQGIYAASRSLAWTPRRSSIPNFSTGKPDDRPMDGLIQWRNIAGANIQIFRDKENAGSGRLTIVVPDMAEARIALEQIGMTFKGESHGDYGRIAQIVDPDGNRITLAEPPSRPFN